jgi:hypothetical protein
MLHRSLHVCYVSGPMALAMQTEEFSLQGVSILADSQFATRSKLSTAPGTHNVTAVHNRSSAGFRPY